MQIFDAQTLDRNKLSSDQKYFLYNGLDSCITQEVIGKLREEFPERAREVYTRARQLQAPALEMMLRGCAVDKVWIKNQTSILTSEIDRLQFQLDRLAFACWGAPLNPNSVPQLRKFFYEYWTAPTQFKFDKGVRKISVDQEALEKLNGFRQLIPFIAHIRAIRERAKKRSVLRTKLDKDGRLRAAFNIGGTETGRWSSSGGAFGGGTNLQNITESLRKMVWADPGYKLAYVDLEQAESRGVGGLVYQVTGDASYLDACESADLHTTVTQLIWPGMEWGTDLGCNRELADQNFFRHWSYRDMAKRGSHGTNYYGTPPTMAKHLNVPVELMREFQAQYFEAFPGIPQWHKWVAQQLQTEGFLSTPFGRGRHFFARRREDATLRKAIAFVPQSLICDYLNEAILNIWRTLPHVQLLAQVHDAVLIQYREELEAQVMQELQQAMVFPISFGDRQVSIPIEAAIGWNWGYKNGSNPDGLIKWKGGDSRVRTENPEASLLDRCLL